MNRFKYMTGPCLVCKKEKPGVAYGITPDLAVCADDWTDNRSKAETALKRAEAGLKKQNEVDEAPDGSEDT